MNEQQRRFVEWLKRNNSKGEVAWENVYQCASGSFLGETGEKCADLVKELCPLAKCQHAKCCSVPGADPQG